VPHPPLSTRITQALHAPDPEKALVAFAKELKAEGVSQSEMYALFKAELAKVQLNPDERLYDAITGAMDRIVGWCSPDQRLFDTQLPT
jgi:hypothetical protein